MVRMMLSPTGQCDRNDKESKQCRARKRFALFLYILTDDCIHFFTTYIMRDKLQR